MSIEIPKVDPEIIRELSARLTVSIPRQYGGIGGSLLYFYGELVSTTGKSTTSQDALNAWLRWLYREGGEPEHPITLENTSPQFREIQELTAKAVVEISRHH
jgi:hypothetical protein